MILDATESFFTEKKIKRIDSSAIPNHPMIDRIWRDRIAMADVLVAGEGISQLRFALTLKALHFKHQLRNQAKTVFYHLTKRKIS